MDENKNVFKVKSYFPLLHQMNTTRINISIDLMNHIMADRKIKDKDLSTDLKDSKSYTIKTLYGIPNFFSRIIKGLAKLNCNKDLGYELPFDLEQADTDEDEPTGTTDTVSMASKLQKEHEYDYFRDQSQQN